MNPYINLPKIKYSKNRPYNSFLIKFRSTYNFHKTVVCKSTLVKKSNYIIPILHSEAYCHRVIQSIRFIRYLCNALTNTSFALLVHIWDVSIMTKKVIEFHQYTLCYISRFQQNKLLVCSYGERIYKGKTFVIYLSEIQRVWGQFKILYLGLFSPWGSEKQILCDMNVIMLHVLIHSSYNIVGADEMEFSFSLKWFCGISDFFFFIAHSIIVLCSMACIVSKIPEGIIQRIIDVLMNVIIRSFIIVVTSVYEFLSVAVT